MMEDLRRTFKILTYAVCTSGFAAMLLTGKLGPFEHLVIFSSLIIGWFWGEELSNIPRATRVATATIVTILILSAIGFIFFKRSFVTTTISFLIYVQAVRILFLSEMRHHLQVYLISLASVLAATILTFSPLFLISFVVYLFLVTGAMITHNFIDNIEVNIAEKGESGEGAEPPLLRRGHLPIFPITVASSSFILLAATVLFIFFPRISAGYLPSELVEPVRISGFSKNVELGEVGTLKVSSAVVMRIVVDREEIERAGAKNIYIRGTAFDTFDGRYWEKSNNRRQAMRRVGRSFLSEKKLSGAGVDQEYFVEPNDNRVLFAISEPVSFEGPFINLFVDDYGTVETRRYFNDKLRYRVTSIISPTSVRSVPLTLHEKKIYLTLPRDLDGRIKPLVDRLTTGAVTDTEKAERIRDYLLNNLSYDLDPGDVGEDPLADFLFVNRKGYCEHFATAMVIMLRNAGIRSRLVTGFLAGNYNDYGSFYTIRASDAHAWVEAYFEGVGWTILDPTPPAGLVTLKEVSALASFVENLKMKWNIYIVNFEMSDQMEMMREVRDVSIQSRNRVSDLKKRTGSWVSDLKEGGRAFLLPVLGIVGIFILFLVLYILKAFFSSRGDLYKGAREGAAKAYMKALSLLDKKGVRRERSMTPGEFSDIVRKRIPRLADDFSRLNRAYLAERFGEKEPYGDTTEEAFGSLKRIVEKLKRGGSA
jgi:hypothetical protein